MTGNFDEWLEGLKSDLPTHCVQRPHGFRTAAERAIGLKKKGPARSFFWLQVRDRRPERGRAAAHFWRCFSSIAKKGAAGWRPSRFGKRRRGNFRRKRQCPNHLTEL